MKLLSLFAAQRNINETLLFFDNFASPWNYVVMGAVGLFILLFLSLITLIIINLFAKPKIDPSLSNNNSGYDSHESKKSKSSKKDRSSGKSSKSSYNPAPANEDSLVVGKQSKKKAPNGPKMEQGYSIDDGEETSLYDKARDLGINNPESYSSSRLEQLIMMKSLQGPGEKKPAPKEPSPAPSRTYSQPSINQGQDQFGGNNNSEVYFENQRLRQELKRAQEENRMNNQRQNTKVERSKLDNEILKTIEMQLQLLNKQIEETEKSLEKTDIIKNLEKSINDFNQGINVESTINGENEELETIEVNVDTLNKLLKKHNK